MDGAMRRPGLAVPALALLGLCLPAAALAAKDETLLVSRGVFGQPASGQVSRVAMSADGRYIAFSTSSTNLHPDDTDSTSDLYVRDLQTGTTRLVSRATGAAGVKGNGTTAEPSISADGRLVAFSSTATNLHPLDLDSTRDIFVRDLQADVTALVSRASSGTKGNGVSDDPAISSDGRHVAFESAAANLHPDDLDATSDVFVRDLEADTTALASRAGGAAGVKGNGVSDDPAISADGGQVAYDAASTNLHPDDADSALDVYLRDVQADTTTLVSRNSAGSKSNGSTEGASISDDGSRIAFHSTGTNLDAADTDSSFDVFVRDLAAGQTRLVSRNSGAAGAKQSGVAAPGLISPDGGHVLFWTAATNLDPADTDNNGDLYTRGLESNVTRLVSRATGATGAKGNGETFVPLAFSRGGRYVAWLSAADNLHPDDTDSFIDVFRRDVLGDAPVNSSQPEIGGQATPGGALACASGSWQNGVDNFAFEWRRSGTPVGGGQTYAVGGADVGQPLTCRVTASNSGGSATATSAPVVPTQQGSAGPAGPAGPQGAPASKLIVALSQSKLSAVRGRRVPVPYVSTIGARVTLEIRRGSKLLVRVSSRAKGGRNRISWNGRVKRAKAAAGRYKLRLAATAADGQKASDRGTLTLRRR